MGGGGLIERVGVGRRGLIGGLIGRVEVGIGRRGV